MEIKNKFGIMKPSLLVLLLILVSCSFECLSQAPKYYFDIEDVYTTSQSFKEKTNGKNYKFRALTIKPSEYSFIAIELIEIGKSEYDKSKLKDTFYIKDADFNEVIISDIKYKEWLSPKKLEVEINKEKCYVLNLEDYKNKIVVEDCN